MKLIGLTPLTGAEKQKRYRAAHPERGRGSRSTWALAHPHKYREGAQRRTRAYEARNPGRGIIRNARFRTTPRGAASYLYSNAKRRAQVDGVEFSLTKEWILAALRGGACQVTGLPFVIANGQKPWAPSLDKTNPHGGYTPDNVKVVVWMYNTCKWAFTHDDVVRFARAVLMEERAQCNS